MVYYLSKKNKIRISIAYIVIFGLFALYTYNRYIDLQKSLVQSQIQHIISDYKFYSKVHVSKSQKDILIDNPEYINNDELVDEHAKSTPLFIDKKDKQEPRYNLTIKFFKKYERHNIDIENKIAKLASKEYEYSFKDDYIELFGVVYDEGYVNIVKQFKNLSFIKETLSNTISIIGITALLNILIFFYLLTLFDEHEENKKEMLSEYEQLSIDAQAIAMTDSLTGASTRIKFNQDLVVLLELASRFKEQTFSFMILDIDNFKRVNDTHGHDYGDEVLKRVAQCVQHNIRKTDYFYRWGGEEFVLLMPMSNLQKSLVYAQKLREKISSLKFEKIEQITCSFGLVEYKAEDNEMSITKRADELLYLAKNNGKNRVEHE